MDDNAVGTAIPQHVFDFVGAQERMDRDDRRPGRENGIVGAREIGDVGDQDRDAVAATDTVIPKPSRVCANLIPQLGVAHRLVADDQRGLAALAACGLGDDSH